MKTFTVKMDVDDSQMQGLFQLYRFHCQSGGENITKKGFLDYIKHQLIMNGNQEFLLPTNGMDDYEDITPDDLNLLMKWGLL